METKDEHRKEQDGCGRENHEKPAWEKPALIVTAAADLTGAGSNVNNDGAGYS